MSEHVQELLDRLTAAIRAEIAALPEHVGTLGDEIRLARRVAGMSLQDVADASGTSKSHIWELEQGRARNPTIAMVSALSCALGVPFLRLAQAALNEIETAGTTPTGAAGSQPESSDPAPSSPDPHVMQTDGGS